MLPLVILGFVFGLVGLPMVLLARRTFARDRQIESWPTTQGTVEASFVGSSVTRDTSEYAAPYVTWYRPHVRFSYSVAGQKFESETIARQSFQTDQTAARAIVDRYPPGKAVKVLHDPANPATAYLEVQRSTGAVILLVFGLFWIVLGAFLWLLAVLS